MSFYNIITGGPNALSNVVLMNLEYKKEEIPRYRDAWIEKDGEEIELVIFTRTGGGNREAYRAENDNLCSHPLYIRDEDDSFDTTYAKFYFRPPEKRKKELGDLYTKRKTLEEATTNFVDSIKKMNPDEVREKYPEACDVMDKVLGSTKY